MKATLVINNPTTPQRRAAIQKALAQAAATLERLIKEKIANSVPAGRTYRRSAITRRASGRTDALGLRRSRKNSGLAIIGFTFHRASAKGQPPAILSGRLINSIRARAIAEFKYRVASSVVYSVYLDNPAGLDRLFFITVAEDFKPVFLEMIRKAFIEGQ